MRLTRTAVGEGGFNDAYVRRIFVMRGAKRPLGYHARIETQVRDNFLRTIAHRLTMRAAWRRWRRAWLRSARREERRAALFALRRVDEPALRMRILVLAELW